MELNLIVTLPTSLNKLYINQATYDKSTGKYISTGKRIMSQEGKHKKRLIQKYAKMQLKQQEWDYDYTKENFIYMDCDIYFNRKGRDDNNIYKLLCDSLEKIAYDNDSRVLIRTQRILYDNENPRVEIKMHPVDYVGVFDNKEDYIEFEETCKMCKRYLNGRCSILNEAIGGRIQEEVLDGECTSFTKKKS